MLLNLRLKSLLNGLLHRALYVSWSYPLTPHCPFMAGIGVCSTPLSPDGFLSLNSGQVRHFKLNVSQSHTLAVQKPLLYYSIPQLRDWCCVLPTQKLRPKPEMPSSIFLFIYFSIPRKPKSYQLCSKIYPRFIYSAHQL